MRKISYALLVTMLLATIFCGFGGITRLDTTANCMKIDTVNMDSAYLDSIDVDTATEITSRYVYLGGRPLGIDVKTFGMIVNGKQDVVTKDGVVMPCKDLDIKQGDELIKIDDRLINSEKDIKDYIRDKDSVTITIRRGNDENNYLVNTAIDILSGDRRLGLYLRDGIQGIGTLTYIDMETKRYGALGHPIEENRQYKCGNVYDANIKGYIKGERGKAGELNGDIIGNKCLGTIDKNTHFGIFGDYNASFDDMKVVKTANRDEVHPGKAYIYTTIDGKEPEKYEIEIIKRVNQSKPQNKGMVLRITDKRLLGETNGILQGMSGSPILQNNKLIGAVTHVFINDPTKGYGMYIDFMMNIN